MKIDTDCHEIMPNRRSPRRSTATCGWSGRPGSTRRSERSPREIRATIPDAPAGPAPERRDPGARDRAAARRRLDRRRRRELDRADRAVRGDDPGQRLPRPLAGRSRPAPARRSARRAGWSRPRRWPARRSSCWPTRELTGGGRKKEFKERRGDKPYTLLIPEGQKPPIPAQLDERSSRVRRRSGRSAQRGPGRLGPESTCSSLPLPSKPAVLDPLARMWVRTSEPVRWRPAATGHGQAPNLEGHGMPLGYHDG